MLNLKEVRTRIASIKSTRQITSAMKMVSASKLRKAQNGILSVRPYAAHLKTMLSGLEPQIPTEEKNQFTLPREGKNILVVGIASNKGLCGTYNTLLVKRTLLHVNSLIQEGYKVKLLLIGKKIEAFFQSREFKILKTAHEVLEGISYEKTETLARELMEMYASETYDRVDVVYNRFKNAVMQELVIDQLLPVSAEIPGEEQKNASPKAEEMQQEFSYILEPSPKEMLDTLVPQYVSLYFYQILLDASASEHGARMTAMHQATDNATELLKSLTLSYNKVRQSMITREIMEIVGGAEVFSR